MKHSNLLMAAAFCMTSLGAAAAADAKPLYPGQNRDRSNVTNHRYDNAQKPYLSDYQHRRFRNRTRRSAVRDFGRMDRNHNGVVTRREYQRVGRRFYRPSSRQSWRILVRSADLNRDRRISKHEFTSMRLAKLERSLKRRYTTKRRISSRAYRRMLGNKRQAARRAFSSLDKNRDGTISRRDFMRRRDGYSYRSPRTGWRRVGNTRDQRIKRRRHNRVSPRWYSLARTYDTNRDGRITSREFVRVQLKSYKRQLLSKYVVGPRHRRNPRAPYYSVNF